MYSRIANRYKWAIKKLLALRGVARSSREKWRCCQRMAQRSVSDMMFWSSSATYWNVVESEYVWGEDVSHPAPCTTPSKTRRNHESAPPNAARLHHSIAGDQECTPQSAFAIANDSLTSSRRFQQYRAQLASLATPIQVAHAIGARGELGYIPAS